MAIKRCQSSVTVVQAAEQRIINVFRNGLPVYMSFSGGKDSLVLSNIVLSLIQRGKIDPSQLTVQFVDEEAIFPCIERTVQEWRKKFLLVGAQFEWYCIEVKHYNCFNMLSEDESFICWDSQKQPVWVRKPPKYAIRTHPLLCPRVDAYQDFMPRVCMDGITITGVRAAESMAGKSITNRRQILPIYDWTNNDVWLYLLENKVDIPDIYLYLWQAGTGKGQLRVSQFFSVDTARSLVKMNEYYPDLMERVIRREPNAYLAALYWDSEMFGRTSKNRRELEKGTEEKDYRAMLVDVFHNIDSLFTTDHQKYIARRYRSFFLQGSAIFDNKDCKKIYEALMKGDPKLRTYRALYQQLYGRYIDEAKKGGI